MPGEAFILGPFERFVELATDPATSRGQRARTLQFAHARADEQRQRLQVDEIEPFDRLLAERLERIGASDADRWLIEVWEGRLGHHGV